MDPRRSKKSRSVGTDAKASKSSTSPASDRPPVVADRTQSAPTARRRQNQTKRTSDGHSGKISNVVDRDSKASIRDDPFFRPYLPLLSAQQAVKENAAPPTNEESDRHAGVPQVNLVVLGSQGVGKSTFVQKALDLRQHSTLPYSAKKMSLDGVVYLVRLLEVPLDDIDVVDSRRISWPKRIGDNEMPSVHGVLALYDVTNRESIADVPEVLHALSKSTTPCVLVSCKCDVPLRARKVEEGFIEKVGRSFGNIETYQTSANVPESQKRCISIVLRSILIKSRNHSRRSSPRSSGPRAATSTGNATSSSPAPSPERMNTHYRAASELPCAKSRDLAKPVTNQDSDAEEAWDEIGESLSSKLTLNVEITRFSERRTRSSQPQTPVSAGGLIHDGAISPSEGTGTRTPSTPGSMQTSSFLRTGTTNASDNAILRSFLNMEDESQDESTNEDTTPSSPDLDKFKSAESNRSENGISFAELVDRLLSLPMSKQETKFVPMFLCLYRKFATPGQLLSALISRFEQVDRSAAAQLTKAGEQLRYLQVLAQWTADYPGDFATTVARRKLVTFVKKLETSRIFGSAAKEINNHLEAFAYDEDIEWACSDEPETHGNVADALVKLSKTRTATSGSRSGKGSADTTGNPSPNVSVDDFKRSSPRHSGASSTASGTTKTDDTSNLSTAPTRYLDNARREARNLVPVPRTRLTKVQWHQFMEIPDEDFARELTRMDWMMYSAIRPRDFVRDVSLTIEGKEKSQSLENIKRMVDHFNHLAIFVSGMILLRDKPKHRAKALEKFMSIAWKVRQQNNYNSLGSIIAGINDTSVHRLALTSELVPPSVQKEFMRLTILMGTIKSHAAYRLAWENSFSERIPFLPLDRRDLLAAENGNRTFLGPAGTGINWRKFEVMGEILIGIQKSQEKAYEFVQTSDEVMKLVLETQICNEDSPDPRQELYDRSIQLEPAGAGVDASRKKFEWFRR